jgi:hypothetical protein
MNSWKTTIFGLLAGIGAGILGAYTLKPELLAGFPKWLPGLGVLLSSISTACLGLAARDNDKTSEDVGAKPSIIAGAKAAFLIFVPIGLAGILIGCQAPAQRIAYNTVDAPSVTVHQAMLIWNDYVGQFHPPAAQELKVKAAYEKYQAAELLALDAAHEYAAQAGSTNSVSAKVQSALTSQAAQQALADLLTLLRSFNLKL